VSGEFAANPSLRRRTGHGPVSHAGKRGRAVSRGACRRYPAEGHAVRRRPGRAPLRTVATPSNGRDRGTIRRPTGRRPRSRWGRPPCRWGGRPACGTRRWPCCRGARTPARPPRTTRHAPAHARRVGGQHPPFPAHPRYRPLGAHARAPRRHVRRDGDPVRRLRHRAVVVLVEHAVGRVRLARRRRAERLHAPLARRGGARLLHEAHPALDHHPLSVSRTRCIAGG
jgi:hypothetical protein